MSGATADRTSRRSSPGGFAEAVARYRIGRTPKPSRIRIAPISPRQGRLGDMRGTKGFFLLARCSAVKSRRRIDESHSRDCLRFGDSFALKASSLLPELPASRGTHRPGRSVPMYCEPWPGNSDAEFPDWLAADRCRRATARSIHSLDLSINASTASMVVPLTDHPLRAQRRNDTRHRS